MHYNRNSHLRLYLSMFVIVGVTASAYLISSLSQSNGQETLLEIVKAIEISTEQEEYISDLPIRLVIPAIKVDASVQYVGLAPDDSGEMDVPSNFTDVGWYQFGVRPGMRGSAVIAGHFNGKTVPKAVFYDLGTLQFGDEVIIMSADGMQTIFSVVKVETYEYDASTVDVFVSTDEKVKLNLITCGGQWLPNEKSYNKRTVAFTELQTE